MIYTAGCVRGALEFAALKQKGLHDKDFAFPVRERELV